jgi:hypothetical protein
MPVRPDKKLDARPALTWIAEHRGLSGAAGIALADKARDVLAKLNKRAENLVAARAAKALRAAQRREAREAAAKRVSPPRRLLYGPASRAPARAVIAARAMLAEMAEAEPMRGPSKPGKAVKAPPVWASDATTGHESLVGEMPDLPMPPSGLARITFEAGARVVLEVVARRFPALMAATVVQTGGDCLTAFAVFSEGRGAVARELAVLGTRLGLKVPLDHNGQPEPFALAVDPDWRRAARISHEPFDLPGWQEALGWGMLLGDADAMGASTHALFAVSPYYSRLLDLEKRNATRRALAMANADMD